MQLSIFKLLQLLDGPDLYSTSWNKITPMLNSTLLLGETHGEVEMSSTVIALFTLVPLFCRLEDSSKQ